jgi:excisionase family DNA binding protein|tara:strand:- start:4441 stop:4692 length:252 start_codon:yes stop_codon:yes gene_type:complete
MLLESGQRREIMSSNVLLSVVEVALRLRVSSRTVQRLIRSQQLRAYRVGRQLRIPELAITELLRNTRFDDDEFEKIQAAEALF